MKVKRVNAADSKKGCPFLLYNYHCWFYPKRIPCFSEIPIWCRLKSQKIEVFYRKVKSDESKKG